MIDIFNGKVRAESKTDHKTEQQHDLDNDRN